MNIKFKKLIALFLCVSLGFSLSSFSTISVKAANDQPSSWALAEVNEAINNELIPLYMQTDYTEPITRKDFCELVIYFIETYAEMGMPAYAPSKTLKVLGESPFSDINDANVNSANILGIANGYPDGTFKPNESIERQAASKMLAATAFALGYKIDGGGPTSFSDQETISSWAETYVNFVYDLGIMNGVGENNFDPHGTYQRQMAYITMNRLYTKLINAEMAEYPPQDPLQYFAYGLGNAGPFTLNYTYEVNHTDYKNFTYYDDGEGNGREDLMVENYLGAKFLLNKFTKDDLIYISLPEKEQMSVYKIDTNSTIMTKIYTAVRGELVSAYILGGEYNYEYRLPFIHDEEMFTSYTFYSKNGDFYKLREEFNGIATEYTFAPIEFGPVSADLFTLPTDYLTSAHDYEDDGENPPFWWEMENN